MVFLYRILFSGLTAALLTLATAYQPKTTSTPGAIRRQVIGRPKPTGKALVNDVASIEQREAFLKLTEYDTFEKALPSLMELFMASPDHDDATESETTSANSNTFDDKYNIKSSSSTSSLVDTPTSKLNFVQDCLAEQLKLRTKQKLPNFVKILTPASCGLDPNDRDGQMRYLQTHADEIRSYQLKHGCVYFKGGWKIFNNEESLEQSSRAVGMTPCLDPFQFIGVRTGMKNSDTVYEASNRPEDSKTHIGMHFEGSVDTQPSRGLFACFQPAPQGGEFLVCDGRRVARDLNSVTLARLQSKQIRPIFADFPDWMGTIPGIPSPPNAWSPLGQHQRRRLLERLRGEFLSWIVDTNSPEVGLMVDDLPRRRRPTSTSSHDGQKKKGHQPTSSLALTTVATGPLVYHPITNVPVIRHNFDAAQTRIFQKRNPHVNKRQHSFDLTTFDHVHGDGSDISNYDIDNIEKAIAKNTVELSMEKGDAVLVDNYMTLHGRKPFQYDGDDSQPQRKHAVIWGV